MNHSKRNSLIALIRHSQKLLRIQFYKYYNLWLHRWPCLNSLGFQTDRNMKKELWGRRRIIRGVPASCRKVKRDHEGIKTNAKGNTR